MLPDRSREITPASARPRSIRPAFRMVRGTVRNVNPFSVFRVSLLFYTSIMIVGIIVSMILYWVASVGGAVENFENLVEALGWTEFQVRTASLLRFLVLVGVLSVAFWSSVNLLLAMLYNLVSDVIGGVELEISEREI